MLARDKIDCVYVTREIDTVTCVSVFHSVLMQQLEEVKQNSKVVMYIPSHCGSADMKCLIHKLSILFRVDFRKS